MRRKKRLLLAGALLVVGGAAVGIAYAAIPSGGVINGCYQKSSGALRVIDAGTTCKKGETSLDWNVEGATGAVGPTEAVTATSLSTFQPPSPLVNDSHAPPVFNSQALEFTTTKSGKLLLTMSVRAQFECSNFRGWVFLILDDSPVAGSAILAPSGTADYRTLQGVTAGVIAAGTHKMDLGGMCEPGSTWAGIGQTGVSNGTAVVLGG